VLRERDDEGRAEIPIVVAPAHPVYGHHWHSWASRWPS
jgi:hypothetical protein